ncbi:MAG TPA: PH domain-containing protein [Xanthomonadaceae bacterium]|nr:PH domain-containing protein [Xanthomonadaceae bacterium]
MPTEFAVAPPPKRARITMGVICAMLLLMAAGLAVALAGRPALAALVVALHLGLMGALVLAYRRRRIRIQDGCLQVAATLYTLRVPVAALELEGARVARLEQDRSLQPFLKPNGFSIPGFHAGHFRSRGGTRLWALITADRVLVLPQREGRTLVLSPERPDALLQALRQLAGRGPQAVR